MLQLTAIAPFKKNVEEIRVLIYIALVHVRTFSTHSLMVTRECKPVGNEIFPGSCFTAKKNFSVISKSYRSLIILILLTALTTKTSKRIKNALNLILYIGGRGINR